MSDPASATANAADPPASQATAAPGEKSVHPGMIAATAVLVVLADWLFAFQAVPGSVVGGFGLAVLIAVLAFHADLLAFPRARWALLLALLMCAALIHDPSALAVGMFVGGMLVFLAAHAGGSGASAITASAVAAGWRGTTTSVVDVFGIPARFSAAGWQGRMARLGGMWMVPLLGGAVFLVLFAAANPIIAEWLSRLEGGGRWFGQVPSADRVVFWCVVGGGTWWLLRSRLTATVGATVDQARRPATGAFESLLSALLPASAIVRSMLVFNVMFAVQNGLDIAYLWGDGPLPAGFTYASYAHRGAYPLMVTALIAAVFVLVAFRNGASGQAAPLARPLMYVWIGQNILLVASSIWRMVLYVEAYSLTYLRLIALVWMGLVAVGLVLMIARFALARTNRWLVDKSVAVVFSTLCVATAADAGGFIADYNVRHCRDVIGRGVVLDLGYLARIGSRALPALKTFAAATAPDPIEGAASLSEWRRHQHALRLIEQLEMQLRAAQADWRRWTYFEHRLRQRLSAP